MSDFFKFEDGAKDFPYYNHNPRISKTAWIVLLICVFISFLLNIIVSIQYPFIGSLIFCFGILIPLLYFSNWDYSLIFTKPTKKEIGLAVLLFIGYIIYSVVMGEIITLAGLESSVVDDAFVVNVEMTISLIFSMMGEELLKFIPLMIIMRLVYKYTSNRKLAMVVSAIMIMIGFGLLHYDGFTITIASALLIQGLGTIFEIYGYYKTKNLFVPYMSHLFTDAFIFILLLLGV
ncbi:hypothetical protein TL18_01200 [Methanobrevibacter sp. YE315]|uniref:hypothetical protein n=1 Tax=Methanobrevibacter sp. YE315 TaxID=1609968 RepID=UPI000764E4DB|nr:hypothetical protein [Methanobrevibacter sp. YE315]AMD16776.1 hypothetical protein TL18_01200 [Methanobrevibacter sp. YE315]